MPTSFVRNQMGNSVLVQTNRNTQTYLWSWSTLTGWTCWSEICFSSFTDWLLTLLLFSRFFNLWGGIEKLKEYKIVRAIPIGWPGLIGNVVPFSSVCWSLTSWPGIMESILNVWGLQPTNNTIRRDPFPVFFLKDRGGWRGKMGIGIIFFFSGK